MSSPIRRLRASSCPPARRDASDAPAAASQFSIAPRAAATGVFRSWASCASSVDFICSLVRVSSAARASCRNRSRSTARPSRSAQASAMRSLDLQSARHQHAGALEPDGDREVDVGAAEVRGERRRVTLPVGQLRDFRPEGRVGSRDRRRELAVLAREQERHLLALQRLAQPVRCDAEQRLAVRVREEPLGELRQGDQVAALGLDEAKPLAGERGEPPDEQARDEEHEERRDVARIRDREGEEGGQEEVVERERREHRGENTRPALPDRGAQEDGEQEQERDRGDGQRGKEAQQPDGRQHDQDGRRVADPPGGGDLHRATILSVTPPAWRRRRNRRGSPRVPPRRTPRGRARGRRRRIRA